MSCRSSSRTLLAAGKALERMNFQRNLVIQSELALPAGDGAGLNPPLTKRLDTGSSTDDGPACPGLLSVVRSEEFT